MRIVKLVLSLFLSLSLIIIAFTGTVSVSANDMVSTSVSDFDDKRTYTTFEVPDIIDKEEIQNKKYVDRIYEEEKDLYTLVFANEDGSHTMRVFGHPVKYIDEEGITRDISLEIKENSDGRLASSQHMVDVIFNSDLNNGINLRYQDLDITMRSDTMCGKARLSEDNKKVDYAADEKTSYVYSLTYAGFKEDIVVKEYTGQTEYKFVMNTNGLHPIRKDESVFLADKNDETKLLIGNIIIFTADEKNNAIGRLEYETIREDQEYRFTILLDSEYLKDEKTVYPITIDPTISVNYNHNGAGAIEDITINQFYPVSGLAQNLYIGRNTNTSLNRSLMKFPVLSLTGICASQITEASVELKDIIPTDNQDMTIECYIYKKTSPNWSENGNTTWSDVGSDYIGTYLDSHIISSGEGNSGANSYSFNILPAARAWASEQEDPDMGLVFKASSSFENQNGNNMKYWNKVFASYNNTDINDKPSLFITYAPELERNWIYSEYDPDKYNDNSDDPPDNNTYTSKIQYRMNCYGYAFGYILNGSALYKNNTGGYKQDPGEFAYQQDAEHLLLLGNCFYANDLMQRVTNNLNYDKLRLGTSINVIDIDEESQLPNPPTSGIRYVILVTGNHFYYDGILYCGDYHFYVRHSNGNWSHKPGSGKIINTSLGYPFEPLTDDNIITRALGGIYDNGKMKLLKINKSPVMDFPHSAKNDNWPTNHNQNTLYFKDKAGDYLKNSRLVGFNPLDSHFDYAYDHDVYCFTPVTTRVHSVTASTNSGADIKCRIYDNRGYFVQSSISTGNVNINIRLVAGQRYFFDVYNADHTMVDYTFDIS